MTGPREPRVSLWTILPVVLAVLLAAGDFGDKIWGSASDSRVTSYQVAQLTSAVRDLASKFDAMAKQSSVDALAGKVDRDETAFGDLKSTVFGMRADVDNLMHPAVRQPR